jgi:3-oxoacyl-[acyl-carrier-protein] synthase III
VIPVLFAGWGVALPERRLTNADLERMVDTSDEWIVERSGIRERRIAAPEESTASLGIDAGKAAIKHAGLGPEDIDLLVLSTATPEKVLPTTAAIVQDGIGLRCGAMDVNAACSGFVYAMVTASAFLATGQYRNILVIGTETVSRIIDQQDRATLVLFGDGAGSAVLQRGPNATAPDAPGLLAWDLGCDGSAAHILQIPAGGSKTPATAETVANRDHYLKMEGREVFKRAVRAVLATTERTLSQAGVTAADVDVFVPHQANIRIIEAARSRLDIPREKTVVNIERYGNTSSASIPLALIEAVEDGRVQPGDLVLLAGFGAGMTWASALLRWGARP